MQGPVQMDRFRGLGPFDGDAQDENPGYASFDAIDSFAEDAGIEAPPAIGQDERRIRCRSGQPVRYGDRRQHIVDEMGFRSSHKMARRPVDRIDRLGTA